MAGAAAPKRQTTRIKSAGVSIPEFDTFRKQLKALGNVEATDEWKDANQAIAQLVVDRAAPRFRSLGRMGARVAKSLRAVRSGVRSEVSFGGSKFPEAAGVEFGAVRNVLRQRSTGSYRGWNQFKAWKGNGSDAGYALFPAIRSSSDEILELGGKAIDDISRKAFPD